MIKKLLLFILLSCVAYAQVKSGGPLKSGGPTISSVSAGSSPAFVSAGGNYTGGGSVTTTSLTSGNHLVVWTIAADTTSGHTCSDGTNTYVIDKANISNTVDAVGNLMHVHSISGTGTITITCTGTTPAVAWVQYSGGTGDIDTTSAGVNPSVPSTPDTTVSPVTPVAFTPTTAATILIDGTGSGTGNSGALAQVDGSYTTDSSCSTGNTCFYGGMGHRVVAASASYTDGWTFAATANMMAVNAAYK